MSDNIPFQGGGARVPPNALEAEKAVLGGVLLENEALNVVLEILEPDDFYSEANGRIYDAMRTLTGTSSPVDHVTLRNVLVQTGRLAAVGGDDYLLSLSTSIPTVANIESHANIIKEKALVRRLISAAHEIAATGYGEYGVFQEFLDTAESSIFNIAKERAKNPYEHVKPVVMRTFEKITEASKRGDAITGLPTGFKKIDDMTAGMHPGDLIIIAGRPGMGKTSFALNVGLNSCALQAPPPEDEPPQKREKRGCVIFSLEMPKEQLVSRMLASEARVDGTRMRTGKFQRDDWPRLANAAGVLSEMPVWIDDTPSISVLELRAKCRRLMAESGIALVVVDYLQLMRSGTRTDNREQEISEISRSLKALAKELEIPVIALSQLNRGVETRGGKDKRPMLSDLRESGAIEQDADTIWFIYRDEVYNPETEDKGIAEVIIGKQRAGPTGTARVRFFNNFTRFENLADEGGYGGGGGGSDFSDG